MNLSTLTRTKYRIGVSVPLVLLLLFPFISTAQTFVGVSSNPADNGTLTTATVTATPPGGMAAGDLVVLYAHTRLSAATFTLSVTGGQSWHQETTWNGNNQATTVFWCTYNGTWAANPTVSGGTAGNPFTAVMYVFRPSNPANSWGVYSAALNAAPASGTAISITGFTTLIPNTVTMGFWGSPDDVTWGGALAAGWSKTGLAVQYRNTGGTDQSHTSAYNIRPTAGTVNAVSQTQSIAQLTRTTRISWMEVAPPSNDLCSGATSLTPGACPGGAIGGTLVGATWTSIPTIGCGVAERSDVWYTFVAPVTNPTISLTAPPANARLQLFSGNCGALTSVSCGNTSIAATGLTIGATYYVRVYSDPNFAGTAGTFNICVTVPTPANNACAGATLITSSTTCNNTAGNVFGATNEGPAISNPNCATGVTYDVWYRFVAQRTNPTITLSNIGSAFTNASLQLLSGACGGLTPLFCGGTSISANYLTPGTSYYIRVYSTGVAPTNAVNSGFDICVTDPGDPPSNDECSGAVNLAVNNTCSNNPGNMAGATPSAQPLGGLCTAPNVYDVWYRFAAVGNATTVITLSSLGANFTNPGIEVFSGTCTTALTSIACGTTSVTTPILVANAIYYVRVYSRTAPPPNGNARFNICLTSNAAPVVKFGNSYVNISKKTTGGVVEPGDTLEIRMTINHTAAQMFNLRYVDNIPSNTAILNGATDRLRIITNEGLFYKQFTLAGGDDAATYKAAPLAGEYNIRMNLAFGSSLPGTPADNTATEFASANGTMSNSDRPRGGGGLLFATAYRVVVTGAVGDTVVLNPGRFIYRTVNDAGTEVTLTATPFRILISEPLNLCSNSIGVNNATEFGGTFGSGITLNRSSDLTAPIPGYSFLNDVNAYNGLGDGRYAIVKNISPRSGTATNANRVGVPGCGTLAFNDPLNCNNRMHGGHWEIDGDHTGTYNSAGNAPPSFTQNSGYMLMVNADYVASEVFSQTINNLCPNTYYEFSAWFRNICSTCGMDSTGAQFTNPPTAPAAGYPGVYPNLSFALNGLDYYSTGEIPLSGWLKKGFVFRTDSNQVSATFSIRNNSQGGGGNDWVMDDIAVATCLPTMSYSPTINPNVCSANTILIADTISSFFDNYTTFKWQRSVNGGASWTDVTGVTTLPDTNYYITSYTVPPGATTLSDSGDLYRVVVATTPDNLVDPNCNISDGVTITLSVLNCGPVLDIDLLSFNGRLVDSRGQLSWSTSQEDGPVTYQVERSIDGRNFSAVGQLAGYNNGSQVNHYSLTDPQPVIEKAWYRVVVLNSSGRKKYSSIIQLKNGLHDFELNNMVNPIVSNLAFDVTVASNSTITTQLIDMAGKVVLTHKQLVYAGTNSINANTASLPAGIYTLRVVNKDQFIVKRIVKKN